MKADQLYARAVVRPISFPEAMEVQVQPTNKLGNGLGWHFTEGPYTWEEIRIRFRIDINYAAECETYFAAGDAALVARPQFMHGQWDIPEGVDAVTG